MKSETTTTHQTQRIAYVVKRYPRFSETFIVNEILAHEAAGVAIEIFALRPPEDTHFQEIISRVRAPLTYLPHENVKASRFWEMVSGIARGRPALWEALCQGQGESGRDMYQALLLCQAVLERHITHLHAHFASLATTITRMAAYLAGVPFTFTAHAKDIFHQSVTDGDLRRKLAQAKQVITVSDFNRAYLRSRFGRDADRVVRVYNGLDLEQFRYATPTERPARIVAVGRLVEKKGFSDLIKACAILAAAGRQFQCDIIGGGELMVPLRQQISDLGLINTVRLLGPRPQQEVVDALHSAAVLAAPCIVGDDGNRDGLPTVLLEAMALGTPCVSTDVTGIPELVRDDHTGLVVPPRKPFVMAQAFARLLDDAGLRERLATSARKLIEREFDITRNAPRLRKIFESGGDSAAVVRADEVGT